MRIKSMKNDKDFAYSIIEEDGITYLTSLPSHIKLEFQLNSEYLNILMVHGSPASNKEYLLENKEEDSFKKYSRIPIRTYYYSVIHTNPITGYWLMKQLLKPGFFMPSTQVQ